MLGMGQLLGVKGWMNGWRDDAQTRLESGSGIRGYGQGQSLDQPRTATLRRRAR